MSRLRRILLFFLLAADFVDGRVATKSQTKPLGLSQQRVKVVSEECFSDNGKCSPFEIMVTLADPVEGAPKNAVEYLGGGGTSQVVEKFLEELGTALGYGLMVEYAVEAGRAGVALGYNLIEYLGGTELVAAILSNPGAAVASGLMMYEGGKLIYLLSKDLYHAYMHPTSGQDGTKAMQEKDEKIAQQEKEIQQLKAQLLARQLADELHVIPVEAEDVSSEDNVIDLDEGVPAASK